MKIWGSQTSSFHTTEEYNSYNVLGFVKGVWYGKELVLNREDYQRDLYIKLLELYTFDVITF